VFAPVCGCDGQTYANTCVAAAAGVRVAREGRCECQDLVCPPGRKPVDGDGDGCVDTCLAPCASDCDCRRFPDDAVVSAGEICPLCPSPLCGTFRRCEEGVCVEHCGVLPPDPCPPPPVCGGIAGIPCPEGQLCELPAGMCDAADLQGVCVPVGDACPSVWAPVCGCDGVTYASDCERQRHGVQRRREGACERVDPAAG
jgi:hypothetical protein